MKKIIFSVALIWLSGLFSFAQQDPQFSQNMHNRLYPNPGVAGSNKAVCANLLGRHQWMGFNSEAGGGAPQTYLFSVHAPVKVLYGGVGMSIYSDQLGMENTFGLKAAYAFRRNIGPGSIGIGAAFGFLNKSLGNEWNARDDYTVDPSIPDNGAGDTKFDMDLGVYYKTNKLYVGVSSTHIPQSELSKVESSGNLNYDFTYKLARHYYIMAGYSYDQLHPSVELQPSVFVKSDATSAQIDLNFNVVYNKMIWGGVSYRLKDAIVPMIGLYYDKLGPGTAKFGYSYDVTTTLLRQHSSGSHEIMLGYCFNLAGQTKGQKHKTVRFL